MCGGGSEGLELGLGRLVQPGSEGDLVAWASPPTSQKSEQWSPLLRGIPAPPSLAGISARGIRAVLDIVLGGAQCRPGQSLSELRLKYVRGPRWS